MMKTYGIRALALFLGMLMLLGAAVACGKTEDPAQDPTAVTTTAANGESATTTATEVVEEVEISRENYPRLFARGSEV